MTKTSQASRRRKTSKKNQASRRARKLTRKECTHPTNLKNRNLTTRSRQVNHLRVQLPISQIALKTKKRTKTHAEMEEYEDFLKLIDDAVWTKSEAIRARRREKGKGKPKVKRTGKEKGVDFSAPAKTCEEQAYAVPAGDDDEKVPKTETREGDFIEALRSMLKSLTDE